MRFVPTDYTERHVIHCPNKAAWDKVVEVLDSHGLQTRGGESFKTWSWADGYDCIRFMAGTHDKFSLYDADPFRYTILEYDDFEWEEKLLTINFSLDELFK